MQSTHRLSNKYHKYSGVIIDMYWDHFLADNWADYSDEDILSFTRRNYKILMKNFLILPAKTKRILPFMMSTNWLASYARLDFLQKCFEGMAIRTPFNSGMENAVSDLKEDYESFRLEFEKFFPEIIEYVQNVEGITISQKSS